MHVVVVGCLVVRGVDFERAGVELGTRKARQLLGLIAVDPVGRVSVDRAVDVLWEDRPPRNARQNVRTLISRLRATCGTDLLVSARAGYRLGDHVQVDLNEAAQLTERAEAASFPALGLSTARGALALLDEGGVLDDEPDAEWAEYARIRHSTVLRRARHTAAESALHLGNFRLAGQLAEAAMAADHFDEEACRLLMRASQLASEPARAVAAYQRLNTTLAAELGIEPAQVTRDLYAAIVRNEMLSV